ncbi:MAG: low affinity iron permease family protein [Alphaproteobacteria bacterium]|nr:low affinity iron permease family protein [Alphaproteobacteria bacterium]
MEIVAARLGRRFFPAFARWCERQVAHPAASVTAVVFVALWLAAGPFVAWSNGWQLIINIG